MIGLLFRLTGLLLLTLASGVMLSHLLEKTPKASLSGIDFLKVQQVLLSNFGISMGLVESGAFFAILISLFLTHQHLTALILTVIGLVCSAEIILVWALFINPINKTVNTWTAQTLPDDWRHLRDSWAYLHIIRSIIAVIGVLALALAILTR